MPFFFYPLRVPIVFDWRTFFYFPNRPPTVYVLPRGEFVAAVARLAVTMCFYLGRKTFHLKTKDLKLFCGVPLAI